MKLLKRNIQEKHSVCNLCGKDFIQAYSNKIFCSKKCAKKSYDLKHKKEPKVVKKICLVCGKEFIAAKYNCSIQKYCSKKCARQKNMPYFREWRNKNREKLRLKKVKKDAEIRKNLKSIFGDACIVCGSKKCIHFHEKNGKEHKFISQYYFGHPKDFVPLCYPCHYTVHYYARIKSSKSDELIELLRNSHVSNSH